MIWGRSRSAEHGTEAHVFCSDERMPGDRHTGRKREASAHSPTHTRPQVAHSLARSKHSSRKPSPRTAWNVSSSRFVFRKLHTTTVPSISITPHIYPQLIQVVVNTPRKQRREGRSLSSNVIPMQHPACGLLRTPLLGRW
jgi:hypothetical protein